METALLWSLCKKMYPQTLQRGVLAKTVSRSLFQMHGPQPAFSSFMIVPSTRRVYASGLIAQLDIFISHVSIRSSAEGIAPLKRERRSREIGLEKTGGNGNGNLQ